LLIEDLGLEAEHYAAAVAELYEDRMGMEAPGLRRRVSEAVSVAVMIDLRPEEWPSRINRAIDAWEAAGGHPEGLRVAAIDPATGAVTPLHR
jgi:hypothetical protein